MASSASHMYNLIIPGLKIRDALSFRYFIYQIPWKK